MLPTKRLTAGPKTLLGRHYQICQDMGTYRLCASECFVHGVFASNDLNSLLTRIYEPALADAVLFIPGQLDRAVSIRGAWRCNFNDEIGCSPDVILNDGRTFMRDEHHVRLNNQTGFLVEYDIHRRNADFSELALRYVCSQQQEQLSNDPLMTIKRCGRFPHHAVHQLRRAICFRHPEVVVSGNAFLHQTTMSSSGRAVKRDQDDTELSALRSQLSARGPTSV